MPPELLLVFLMVYWIGAPLPSIDTPPPQVAESAADIPPPPRVSVVTYPDAPVLIQRSNPVLSEIAQQAWDTEFAHNSFFSAFAVSKDGGYGYATTANTPQSARDIARRQCETVNSGCRVIAEIHPAGYTEPAPGALTLSVEVANYYAEAASYERHRAMAISNDGAYSLVWGYDTQAEAEAQALSDCDDYRMRDLPGLADYPCVILPGLE